jgi:ribosomal-protein-alanine N-acetyltransferase
VVIRKQDSAWLGWCGLKQHADYVDLGFRFFRKSWGNGYATESAMACLEYGINELNIKHIVGRVAIGNNASVRVLEKFEMTFWKNEFCHGMEVEYCIMPSVHS